jgi:bifunctional non-homologous end joining protein LigD
MKGLTGTDPALWPGHEPAISIESVEDLLAVAQMDGIELHTWNSTADAILAAGPDDLRPGPGRAGALGTGAGGRAAHSHPAPGAGPEELAEDLRNGQSQSTVAAFSARARPGLGVSVTVAWEELPEIAGGAEWNIATALARCAKLKRDPWAGYWRSAQSLTAAMAAMS